MTLWLNCQGDLTLAAVVIHEVEHTTDVHLRQRLKDRMVDWLVARRILERPPLSFPRGREVKVAIFPGTDALIDRAKTIFQLAF